MGEIALPSPELRGSQLLNTPLEIGLRATILLAKLHPRKSDAQRLVYMDYILVHSGDILSGPESIHTATPYRGGEVLVRKELIQQGLLLMIGRGLVDVVSTNRGLEYLATESAAPFLDQLRERYNMLLIERAEWVTDNYGGTEEAELQKLFDGSMDRWGTEFIHTHEAILDNE